MKIVFTIVLRDTISDVMDEKVCRVQRFQKIKRVRQKSTYLDTRHMRDF